jgi:N-acetyl-gamma-glutamyl-phosphate reductase
MIKAGIIGAAGYTGGELIRILLHHSKVEIEFCYSRSQLGKNICDIHTDLLGDTELIQILMLFSYACHMVKPKYF